MKILIVSLLSLFFVSCGLLFDAEHMMVTKVKSYKKGHVIKYTVKIYINNSSGSLHLMTTNNIFKPGQKVKIVPVE